MKSKYKSVNEQKLKQDQETIKCHLNSLKKRGYMDSVITDCPVCNRKDMLAVVINEKVAVAKCARCNVGAQVYF